MKSLCIDTSAHLCAAAVHDSAAGLVLAQCTEDIGRGHAERLMEIIAKVLTDAQINYSDLERVVATRGPGSFTGVRIGLATARGIALALNLEALGISTLETCAFEARGRLQMPGDTPLLAVLDARRGEAFCQIFDGDGVAHEPFVLPYHSVASLLHLHREWEFCGSGAQHLNTAAGTGHKVLHELGAVPIASIARLGAIAKPGANKPEPLYLRAPDARPQEGFALLRA